MSRALWYAEGLRWIGSLFNGAAERLERVQGDAVRADPRVQRAVESGHAGEGDDLTRLKGVGPKLAARLRELGITQFSQIAAWGEADIDQFDSQLGDFAGRIRRDSWVEQANLLASGDDAAFKAKFGAV